MPLLKHYRTIEKSLNGCIAESPGYAGLVVPNGNDAAPIHRWFHFKEAFSNILLRRLLEDFGYKKSKKHRFLDPFAGVGTSITSCFDARQEGWDVEGTGFEVNPLFHLIGSTKARATTYEAGDVEKLAASTLDRLNGKGVTLPSLSSLRNKEVISRTAARYLVQCSQVLQAERKSNEAADPLLVGLASAVETVSHIRKDGRALRIVDKENMPQTKPTLKRAWATIVEDLRAGKSRATAGTIHLGDARALNGKIADEFDFVLYSPPYPNNIDYTEVYKLELSALGFITNNAEFRSQRLKTLRSHPSISFPDRSYAEQLGWNKKFTKIIQPVLDAIPEDRYERGRTAVVRGYFDDMLISLNQQYKKLRRGGRVFCVVGNSVHGKEAPLVIASDLVLAKIGDLVGFDVEKVAIARHLSRRKVKKSLLPYARESIVVLKKP